MEITANEWNKYINTQEAIRKKAAALMSDWIKQNGVIDRDAMIDFAKALTDKYGEASATYACQLFDEIAEASGVLSSARPADVATYGEVGKAINGSLKQSPSGKIIPQVVERLTKQAGADTIIKNAREYGAEWAWIPDGGSCVFCMTLASRGWQKLSKKLQNSHAEHIHANCNCEFAVRFNKNDNVKGYEPEKYLKEYEKYGGNLKAWRSSLDKYVKDLQNKDVLDITEDFFRKAQSGSGKVVLDKNLSIENHQNEIDTAKWLFETFGGNIKVLDEKNNYSRKTPDYLWNNHSWDLKTTTTAKSANSAVRSGLKQIVSNPGGIILDYGEHSVNINEIEEVVLKRMKSSLYKTKNGVNVIIRTQNEVKVLRYKK